MIQVRRSQERGHSNHGWLDSYHTFSFADYHDPDQMGFRVLRVINEDRIIAGSGFPTHGHRDMEIVSFVISGALEHKDSLDTSSVIRPGEIQRMSAGVGIRHSEFNHSQTEPCHFLQIWILPEGLALEPSYEQKSYLHRMKRNDLTLLASRYGRDESITINQDVEIHLGLLEEGEELSFDLRLDRHVWIQMVKGQLEAGGQMISEGDGLAVSEISRLDMLGLGDCQFLLFDLP